MAQKAAERRSRRRSAAPPPSSAACKAAYPDAHCALDYRSPLELLVATILSAQCTDVRVNMVTPAALREVQDRRRLRALARGACSSARSARPASSTPRRRASARPAPRSRPSTAARSRTRWRSSSRCPASDARPPTSSSATPSARTRASSSTRTSAACPAASASRGRPTRSRSSSDLNALVPKGRRTLGAHLLIFHGRTHLRRPKAPLRRLPGRAPLPENRRVDRAEKFAPA